jgi:hypothetical protein
MPPLPMASVAALRSTTATTTGSAAAEAEARNLAQQKRIEDMLPAMRGAQHLLVFFYAHTYGVYDLQVC